MDDWLILILRGKKIKHTKLYLRFFSLPEINIFAKEGLHLHFDLSKHVGPTLKISTINYFIGWSISISFCRNQNK